METVMICLFVRGLDWICRTSAAAVEVVDARDDGVISFPSSFVLELDSELEPLESTTAPSTPIRACDRS